ncbi:MAG: glycosyltransferase family 2 protein [Planctomycetota bacterium]
MICFAATLAVTLMFLSNLLQFRRAPLLRRIGGEVGGEDALELPCVSVLIPARNEVGRLGATLESLVSSQSVDLEVLVLDDESTDGTDVLVESWSRRDSRVRLLRGRPKPAGWSGKQWACQQLGEAARHEELVFVDADVQVAAEAIARTVSLRRRLGVDLLSGFPRQRVVSPGEQLLIPQMHVILLCFLPFLLMRGTRMVAASAGCGQYMALAGSSWRAVGGHGLIRESLHDGIRLPRALRERGLRTDVFDATDLVECRMYDSFGETWRGLLKNAVEGFAKQPLLLVMTALIGATSVMPVLLAGVMIRRAGVTGLTLEVAVCVLLSYLPRFVCCLRFDRAWAVVWLQPAAMLLFLVVQWTAWVRSLLGLSVQWRSRTYEAAGP